MSTLNTFTMARRNQALALLLTGGLLVSIAAVCVGPVLLNLSELLNALFLVDSENVMNKVILWNIRIPRLFLGLLVGGGLAVCGAVMQGLFRNPLADPGLIGVSSGAALGAAVAIVLDSSWFGNALQAWLTPLCAFAAGCAITLLVYRIATQSGQTQVATLLLAGVAIQAITGAGVGLLTYIADDNQLRDLTFWSMGSLGGAQWDTVAVSALLIVPAAAVLIHQSKGLNAMLLGEAEAGHIGVRVERLKIMVIVFSALLVGAAVSAAGMIGFVGLVVPHLVRLAWGADHRFLIPASALLGGILLVLADMVARTLVSPAELPIGILTALLGGPFFVYLLLQQRLRLM